MKLENQIIQEAQARKLKELGIVQDSLFYHYTGLATHEHGIKSHEWVNDRNVSNAVFSAFTVAELGVMLPERIKHVGDYYPYDMIDCPHHSSPLGYRCFITPPDRAGKAIQNDYTSEAQARAAMLIYLLENNHIAASECNERLKSA